ncbi:Uma2 family endonuclease [Nocardioides sp. LHD-245]|uniref:Uma2 family endonuclease n=1 Tax=Nocardioides sp. LHD-245 TaxID=3051387 RepID=UPI0027E05A8D|nr:Uma2 family endonuclease [Nocardioides sp. LHD-245]
MDVSVAAAEETDGLRRVPMSYEEWLALPDNVKVEWVDGEAVFHMSGSPDHQDAAANLLILLRHSLTGVKVYPEVAVRLPRNRVRIPDLLVTERRPEGHHVTEPPILVVEVLSPSTRNEDLFRKSLEYVAGGVGQYWIVDRRLRAIDVLASTDGEWSVLLHLDEETPTGEVTVGEFGVVPLDLAAILGG